MKCGFISKGGKYNFIFNYRFEFSFQQLSQKVLYSTPLQKERNIEQSWFFCLVSLDSDSPEF